MSNYFQGTSNKPFHLSVGAVLFNDKGEIACHHFINHPRLDSEAYILMRETIEEGESIEQALNRGLMEEFGATGEIITYVGSLVKPYKINDITIQKTTIYFAIRLIDIDSEKRLKDDPEAGSNIEWLDPKDLARKMKKSAKKLKLTDMDESEVIERITTLDIINTPRFYN